MGKESDLDGIRKREEMSFPDSSVFSFFFFLFLFPFLFWLWCVVPLCVANQQAYDSEIESSEKMELEKFRNASIKLELALFTSV